MSHRNGHADDTTTPHTHSTFTPLLFSCIFYGANGQNHVDYVDALFNCVSAMTVTGLATVDLSSLTNFQQALLFFQMCIGSTVCPSRRRCTARAHTTQVFVSWIMVYIRVYVRTLRRPCMIGARP